MRAYVITILKEIKSVRMADRCIKTAKEKSDLEVNYYPAVTPNSDPMELARIQGVPTEKFLNNSFSRPLNCLSCFLSHYFLWMLCENSKEDFLIFEHDAVVDANIQTHLPHKGLLSFGRPSYGRFNKPSSLGVQDLISKPYLPGAHAYLITPKAAREMVRKARMEAEPTDVFLNVNRFDFLQEYYVWPVSVRDTFSSVQNMRGIKAKHEYWKNPETYEILDI